jgi:hypothetical protein
MSRGVTRIGQSCRFQARTRARRNNANDRWAEQHCKMAAADRRLSSQRGTQSKGRLDYCLVLSGLSGSTIENPPSPSISSQSRRSRLDRRMVDSEAVPTFDVLATKAKPARRIVKASTPQHTFESSQARVPNDDKDDSETKERVPLQPHYSLTDSPIRRERVKEDADSTRMKRIESAKDHQAAKREKILQERRLNPKPPSDTPKANPFSRFISAFSVAPKHPEHKRAWQIMPSDKEDLLQPEEKRLRASDDNDESIKESESAHDPTLRKRPVLLTTIAVVVLAALVAWSRRK